MSELRLIHMTKNEYMKKHFGIWHPNGLEGSQKPKVWREHKNQTKDFYFSFTYVSEFNSMNKRNMMDNQQKELFNIPKKFQYQC